MIKVLLAEDHNIVRDGIRSLLETDPEITVIDEAVNGREVIEKIAKGIIPDIILADINMPELSGLELIKELKDVPNISILILSMLDHESYVLDAINSGASGYLLKNISKDELIFAIKHIAAGQKYICSELSFKMLLRVPLITDCVSDEKSINLLSKREKEVLALIGEGHTNVEIADILFTSRRTVEGHRLNLIEKTGVRNTAALIIFAVKNGIIN